MNTRSIRITFGAALLTLLLSLTACGPGMGGSGTGQTTDPPPVGATLPPFGASVAALCTSDLAPALACPSGSAVSPDVAARGTAPLSFVGSVDATEVRAWLEGNRIEFTVGCTQWRFVGDWAAVAGQEPRFFGTINPGSDQAVVATLQAQRDGLALLLTVRAADGTALYGPVRMAATAAAPSCP
jgi:hypothetical protein